MTIYHLNIAERLLLANSVLPKIGDILTLRIVRELETKLSFSEEEQQARGMRSEGDQVFWERNANAPEPIEIGEAAVTLIRAELKRMSEKKLLTMNHVSLYEKFVETDPGEAKTAAAVPAGQGVSS